MESRIRTLQLGGWLTWCASLAIVGADASFAERPQETGAVVLALFDEDSPPAGRNRVDKPVTVRMAQNIFHRANRSRSEHPVRLTRSPLPPPSLHAGPAESGQSADRSSTQSVEPKDRSASSRFRLVTHVFENVFIVGAPRGAASGADSTGGDRASPGLESPSGSASSEGAGQPQRLRVRKEDAWPVTIEFESPAFGSQPYNDAACRNTHFLAPVSEATSQALAKSMTNADDFMENVAERLTAFVASDVQLVTYDSPGVTPPPVAVIAQAQHIGAGGEVRFVGDPSYMIADSQHEPKLVSYAGKPIGSVTTDIRPDAGDMPDDIAAKRFAIAGELYEGPGANRGWPQQAFGWSAPALSHRPLYFAEVNTERHGYSFGVAQPVVSAANFFARIPALPYLKTVFPARRWISTLGKYRPGSYAPFHIRRVPLRLDASAVEGAVVAGLFYLIP